MVSPSSGCIKSLLRPGSFNPHFMAMGWGATLIIFPWGSRNNKGWTVSGLMNSLPYQLEASRRPSMGWAVWRPEPCQRPSMKSRLIGGRESNSCRAFCVVVLPASRIV